MPIDIFLTSYFAMAVTKAGNRLWLSMSDSPFRVGAPDTITVYRYSPDTGAEVAPCECDRISIAKELFACRSFTIEEPLSWDDADSMMEPY